MANLNKDLLTEIQQIDSINKKKRESRGFSKNSVAGSVRILDSVDAKEEEAKEVVSEAPEVKDEAPKAEPEKPAEPVQQQQSVITPELLKEFLTTAVTNAVAPLQQSLEATQAKAQELESKLTDTTKELEQTKEELATKAKDANILNDLSKLMGKPVEVPAVNRMVTSKSDKPEGALKDYFDLADRAPKAVKTNAKGLQFAAKDNYQLNQFVKENKKQLIKDLESYAKNNGFLNGGTVRFTDATTIATDLPGGFLDTLSTIMRTNNRPGFVFWQFPQTSIEWAKGEGDTIRVPRAAFQPAPADPNDRLLSGNGTYYRIDPTSQSIATGTVSCVLKEWGIGRNSQFPPIGIPAFVQAYSMIDLISILERNIQWDYWNWEDLLIRSLWSVTSRAVYNDKSAITTTSSNVASGDNGTMTYSFLNNLYAYMQALLIPTYMDGCYGIVMPSQVAANFKNDLGTKYQYVSAQEIQDLTNILNPSVLGGGEVDKVQGYLGKYASFHIFTTNSYGVGAAGTEGVRNETINSTSIATRSSYAFGADTIGRGIGTEMEIRNDPMTDFGRSQRYIWRSEENAVPLDVDPTGYSDTSNVPQQLRVIDVRTIDTAV